MQWISVLLLAIAVSFDSIAIGSTHGIARIGIPLVPRLLVSLISAVVLVTAMGIGELITHYFTPASANTLGAMVLILLGFYSFWRSHQEHDSPMEEDVLKMAKNPPSLIFNLKIPFFGLIIQVIKEPLTADRDNSKQISVYEALILGLALALDSLAAGIGAAVLELPVYPMIIAVVLANLLFLSLGLNSGALIQQKAKKPVLRWLPGTIIIVLGLLRFMI